MDEESKKTDRRVLKTKKAIRGAFAELLSKKNINEITIKDISNLADINRKTFYNYYKGVYQLVDEAENEIAAAFEKTLKDVDFKQSMRNPYEILTKLTAVINSNLEFYGSLLKMSGNVNLVSKIAAVLKSKVKESFAGRCEVDDRRLEIMADYSVSGMVAIYQNWFNSERRQSIRQLSKIISTMCFSGINGMLAHESGKHLGTCNG